MLASVSAASIVSRASSVGDKLTLHADFHSCGGCALDPRASNGRWLLRLQLVALPAAPIIFLVVAIAVRTYVDARDVGRVGDATKALDAWNARWSLSLAMRDDRRAIIAAILRDPSEDGNATLEMLRDTYQKTETIVDMTAADMTSTVRVLHADVVSILENYTSFSNTLSGGVQSLLTNILRRYDQLLSVIDTDIKRTAADAEAPPGDVKIEWTNLLLLQDKHNFVAAKCMFDRTYSSKSNISEELTNIFLDELYRYQSLHDNDFGILLKYHDTSNQNFTMFTDNSSSSVQNTNYSSNVSCEDFLEIISGDIVANITSISKHLDSNTRNRIARVVALQIASVCVAFVCALFVANNAHATTTSIHLCAQMCASTIDVIMKDKRRCEMLLREMLPKEIIKRLRTGALNVNAHAHEYDSVTVCFSDVADFDEISASAGDPMNIVRLLNDIYNTMDEKIDEYDVYKVETVGSTYMVASGLPVENGDRHSSEIGAMALDLLRTTRLIKVHHMPGRKVQLRTGIHTGPCCAGVVGNKMPRYCLFGDTVNTASRLQTSGLALKIQISEQTYLALKKEETFTMEYRGSIHLKGKGTMDTYWLLSRQTRLGLRTRIQKIPHGPVQAGVSGESLELSLNVPQYNK